MTEVVMKAVALVQTAETDDPNGAFDVILSAPTLDRDGEIIDTRAFDPLPDHIPFDVDHSMTVTGTVGSGQPYYDESGNLRVKGTFASTGLGQEVRTLVNEGHIRTTSVTFMAAERVKDDKDIMHVKRAELLNGTFTPVPSNRESVVVSAKALVAALDEKVAARNSSKDMEHIQAAHDAMAALGAACGKSHADADIKTTPDQGEDIEQAPADAGESTGKATESTVKTADAADEPADETDAALAALIEQRTALDFG